MGCFITWQLELEREIMKKQRKKKIENRGTLSQVTESTSPSKAISRSRLDHVYDMTWPRRDSIQCPKEVPSSHDQASSHVWPPFLGEPNVTQDLTKGASPT
ncbi:hypothetical protein PIB30_099887 [Stylosanthes scabra]|uniref:Uncharacterized protein n=1 Tax=Stylosanthes scabra TaxID=79078 RepID=A0ABU6WWY0_9FABA|nr:hypothetical protein [Stylosanthes scabra]